ncbi:hypothetical protein Dimus_025580 [Dionaea muscipula]
MALRTHLKKRRPIFTTPTKPLTSVQDQAPPSPAIRGLPAATNAAELGFPREYKTSPDYVNRGFFRRILPWRATNQAAASTSPGRFPEFVTLPAGEKLREMLRGMTNNIGGENRISPIGFAHPAPSPVAARGSEGRIAGLTVEDARRILRVSMVEKLKARLRAVGSDTVSYSEFVRICVDGCESEAQGLEFAKLLDESGNVIVLGNLVLIRPEQVVKSVETWLCQLKEPRKRQLLEELERQKGFIDRRAQELVRRELYCGLGLLAAQILGFMRLTFWELSWDVMEPICFFVTSLHFAMAYAFFIRTSTEPSFQAYFQRRFEAKQRKLMKLHHFDVDTYNQLCRTFYSDHMINKASFGNITISMS